MNTETGEIIGYEIAKEIAKINDKPFDKMFVKVNESDMTSKQKKNKMVSLSDHRSKLGKVLTLARKNQNINRKDICPCGSGLTFKYCCRNKKKDAKV